MSPLSSAYQPRFSACFRRGVECGLPRSRITTRGPPVRGGSRQEAGAGGRSLIAEGLGVGRPGAVVDDGVEVSPSRPAPVCRCGRSPGLTSARAVIGMLGAGRPYAGAGRRGQGAVHHPSSRVVSAACRTTHMRAGEPGEGAGVTSSFALSTPGAVDTAFDCLRAVGNPPHRSEKPCVRANAGSAAVPAGLPGGSPKELRSSGVGIPAFTTPAARAWSRCCSTPTAIAPDRDRHGHPRSRERPFGPVVAADRAPHVPVDRMGEPWRAVAQLWASVFCKQPMPGCITVPRGSGSQLTHAISIKRRQCPPMRRRLRCPDRRSVSVAGPRTGWSSRSSCWVRRPVAVRRRRRPHRRRA